MIISIVRNERGRADVVNGFLGRSRSLPVRGESKFEKCTLSVKLTFWGRGGKSSDA